MGHICHNLGVYDTHNHYKSIGETFYSPKLLKHIRTKEVIEINDCQSCTHEPFEGDSFCRQCGNELPEPDMFECPECDAEVFEEDSFCYSCGTKFEGLQEDQEELDIDAPQPPMS